MIDGTQALLQRQMETNKPFEGQETKTIEREQVPSGQDNLVPSNETKIVDPRQTKNCRRSNKTSKRVKIKETPMETPVHESIQDPL